MARPRCERCLKALSACYCAHLPELANTLPIIILQHPLEARHALGTARIVALACDQVELWEGEDFSAHERLRERLAEPGWALLYPGEQALSVAEWRSQGRSLEGLIVLDGSWRKTRKMLYRNPALAALPRLCLDAEEVSRYTVRAVPDRQSLSTVEACAEFLGAWHQHSGLSPVPDYGSLTGVLEQMVAHQLSKMPPEIRERTLRLNQRRLSS